jgi:hypothetical protein
MYRIKSLIMQNNYFSYSILVKYLHNFKFQTAKKCDNQFKFGHGHVLDILKRL